MTSSGSGSGSGSSKPSASWSKKPLWTSGSASAAPWPSDPEQRTEAVAQAAGHRGHPGAGLAPPRVDRRPGAQHEAEHADGDQGQHRTRRVQAGGERPGHAGAEDATGGDEVLGGRAPGRLALAEVQQAGDGDGDQAGGQGQAHTEQRVIRARAVLLGHVAQQEDAEDDQGRRHEPPGEADDRAAGGVDRVAGRAGDAAVDAEGAEHTEGDEQDPGQVPAPVADRQADLAGRRPASGRGPAERAPSWRASSWPRPAAWPRCGTRTSGSGTRSTDGRARKKPQ